MKMMSLGAMLALFAATIVLLVLAFNHGVRPGPIWS